MSLNVPELERRLSSLQSDVKRLWQRTEWSVPLEQRLSVMADEYADYLKKWTHTVERHTRAVTELEGYIGEWKDASSRLHDDSAQRLDELQGRIEREWNALKAIHEAPVKELREQAASLTAFSIAAAGTAQHGFERTERRLATLEGEFQLAVNELTRELRLAVAEIKSAQEQPATRFQGAAPWPLDDVTRLHRELRDPGDSTLETHSSLPAADLTAPSPPRHFPLRVPADTTHRRRQTDARPDVAGNGPPATDTMGQKSKIRRLVAVLCLCAAGILAAALWWRMDRDVRIGAERLQQVELDSARRVAVAEQETAAVREEATREIAAARETALRAQTIANVLAAADLVRYSLYGADGALTASGQVLWSRSRGLVFSGSGIPPPPQNKRHQLWLLTRVAAVAAGTLVVEPDGTATTVQRPPFVSRPVIGVMVTTEDGPGTDAPSGDIALTSVRPVL